VESYFYFRVTKKSCDFSHFVSTICEDGPFCLLVLGVFVCFLRLGWGGSFRYVYTIFIVLEYFLLMFNSAFFASLFIGYKRILFSR
jgi:hypothetical protein